MGDFVARKKVYKITISCVVYIEFLRRKILLEFNKNTVQDLKKEITIINQDNSQEIISIFKVNDDIIVRKFPKSTPIDINNGWYSCDENDDKINHLNSLLQLAPSLITAKNVAKNDYFKVITPKGMELMKKKGKDAFCANLAYITNPKRTVAHADIVKAKLLRNLAGVNVIFNCVSFIVAQQHLKDINKKLSTLQKIANDIAQFQKNKRQNDIVAAIDYCEQIVSSIIGGDLSQEYLNQIEAIERQMTSIQGHILEDLDRVQKDIQYYTDKEWWGSYDLNQKITDSQKDIHKLYQELILCISTRVYAWKLLCAFPEKDERSKNRLKAIKEAINKSLKSGKIVGILREKIEDIKSFWNTN